MNKQWIIGSLVGGLILFIWQFISWAAVNFHSVNQQYTPNQAAILECFQTNITEDGSYFLPNVAPGASSDDHQKLMESSIGKPWAVVSYHKEMEGGMGMNLLRGFSADIVAVLLLCWIFSTAPSINVKQGIFMCVMIGLVGYLTTQYSLTIWFKHNSWPDLLDAIVPWTLCGAWLGFWFGRK